MWKAVVGIVLGEVDPDGLWATGKGWTVCSLQIAVLSLLDRELAAGGTMLRAGGRTWIAQWIDLLLAGGARGAVESLPLRRTGHTAVVMRLEVVAVVVVVLVTADEFLVSWFLDLWPSRRRSGHNGDRLRDGVTEYDPDLLPLSVWSAWDRVKDGLASFGAFGVDRTGNGSGLDAVLGVLSVDLVGTKGKLVGLVRWSGNRIAVTLGDG